MFEVEFWTEKPLTGIKVARFLMGYSSSLHYSREYQQKEASVTSFRCVALKYHTFIAPLPRVWRVTLAALRRMRLEILPQGPSSKGAYPTIVATARDWEAEIDLQSTDPETTRMRVLTKEGVALEKNTASEILSQVVKSFEEGLGWHGQYVKA